MFAFNELHTHGVMAILSSSCHSLFLQLLETHHVKVAKSLVPKRKFYIQKLYHICVFLLNINIKKVQVLLPSCIGRNGFMDMFTLQPSLSNSTFKPSKMDCKLVTKLSKDRGRLLKNTMYSLYLQSSPQWNVIDSQAPSRC